MKFFAAFLRMLDTTKSQDLRPQHIQFLEEMTKEGKILARGKFTDNSGGLVIYRVESLEEATKIAEGDPYVQNRARSLEIHEWDMKLFG